MEMLLRRQNKNDQVCVLFNPTQGGRVDTELKTLQKINVTYQTGETLSNIIIEEMKNSGLDLNFLVGQGLAEIAGSQISLPRLPSRQRARDGLEETTPATFYKSKVFEPFLDEIDENLTERFGSHQAT
uniref:Uncharacterized protein n=1 Tax=Romanomermis culicivorax TaxID=13658 RepID=A0A915J7Q5_ROMCU